jgi:hypothetical protein
MTRIARTSRRRTWLGFGAILLLLVVVGGLGWWGRGARRVVLLVIPGTLAESQTWWRDEPGTFTRTVADGLRGRGLQVQVVTFTWRADNSHRARLDGAQALRERLRRLPPGRLLVITHSHGASLLGLVAASGTLPRPLHRAVLLATPCLVTELRGDRKDAPPRRAYVYFAPDFGERVGQVLTLSNPADHIQTVVASGLDGVTAGDLEHSEIIAAWCRFHSRSELGEYRPPAASLLPGRLVHAERTLELPGVENREIPTDLPFTLNPITEHAVVHSLEVARHVARILAGDPPDQVLAELPVLTDPDDQGDAPR